jgi:hypothetical protein
MQGNTTVMMNIGQTLIVGKHVFREMVWKMFLAAGAKVSQVQVIA